MALPPLTRQASSTSQLQTTPIFSLITSMTVLRPSSARIPPPLREFFLSTPGLAAGGPSHNVARTTTLASGTLSAWAGGASSRSTGPFLAKGCLDGRQLHPPLGTEEFERPEGALVGHLAGIGDPV